MDEVGVMDVDDGEIGADSDDDNEEVLRLNEPLERVGAQPDGRAVQRLADPRLTSLSDVKSIT